MSFTSIYIHAVWSTKNREALLTHKIRAQLFKHIQENAKEKKIHIVRINGVQDHIHCLISLSRNQNVSEVIKLIKGESSFWINKQGLIDGTFQWQREYYASSVGLSETKKVIEYIDRQEIHHKLNGLNVELNSIF